MIKNGDFIEISSTAKCKDTGEVICTTDKEIAKKAGIYDEMIKYGEEVIIVGHRYSLIVKQWNKPVSMAPPVVGKNVGDEFSFEVPPEEGLGEKRQDAIKMWPIRKLQKLGIIPKIGTHFFIDGSPARILSVNGGRVLLDLNHPLAGKTLVYTVKVKRKITNIHEKIKGLEKIKLPKGVATCLNGKVLEIFSEKDLSKDEMMIDMMESIQKILPELEGVICRKRI